MTDNDDLINGYWARVHRDYGDTESNEYVNLRNAIGLRVVKVGSRHYIGADYPTGVVPLALVDSGSDHSVRYRMVELLRGLR